MLISINLTCYFTDLIRKSIVVHTLKSQSRNKTHVYEHIAYKTIIPHKVHGFASNRSIKT